MIQKHTNTIFIFHSYVSLYSHFKPSFRHNNTRKHQCQCICYIFSGLGSPVRPASSRVLVEPRSSAQQITQLLTVRRLYLILLRGVCSRFCDVRSGSFTARVRFLLRKKSVICVELVLDESGDVVFLQRTGDGDAHPLAVELTLPVQFSWLTPPVLAEKTSRLPDSRSVHDETMASL